MMWLLRPWNTPKLSLTMLQEITMVAECALVFGAAWMIVLFLSRKR